MLRVTLTYQRTTSRPIAMLNFFFGPILAIFEDIVMWLTPFCRGSHYHLNGLHPFVCICNSFGSMPRSLYFFVDTSLYALSTETIKLERAEKWRHKKYFNIWRLTCKHSYTAVNIAHNVVKKSVVNVVKKSKKYGSHTAPSYSYSLWVCQMWWRSDVI